MKKVIRLSEDDLTRIVKRVIEEQLNEDSFTFGDKVRNKLGKLVGLPERTDDEERLADDILSKVESGEYDVLDGYGSYMIPKGYKIVVNLDGEDYIIKVVKERTSIEGGASSTSTYVTKSNGEKINIPGKGFAQKIMRLVDESGKFKFPEERLKTKFRPKVGSAMY
jgi:hypothetical protein